MKVEPLPGRFLKAARLPLAFQGTWLPAASPPEVPGIIAHGGVCLIELFVGGEGDVQDMVRRARVQQVPCYQCKISHFLGGVGTWLNKASTLTPRNLVITMAAECILCFWRMFFSFILLFMRDTQTSYDDFYSHPWLSATCYCILCNDNLSWGYLGTAQLKILDGWKKSLASIKFT